MSKYLLPQSYTNSFLRYSLNIVPSCVSVHNNNIALGHETGITVLSCIPNTLKLTVPLSTPFAKAHTFKLNLEYSEILENVQQIRYSSNYIVAINFNDDVAVIDHINSKEFILNSSSVITSFDIKDHYLAVIYDNRDLKIWDMRECTTPVKILKLGQNAEIVRFYDDKNDVVVLENKNDVRVIDWKQNVTKSRTRLNSSDSIKDIIASGNSKPIVVYDNLQNSVYLQKSVSGKSFGHLLLPSNIIETGTKNIDVSSILSRHIVLDGEIDNDTAVMIAGTRLFIVKLD